MGRAAWPAAPPAAPARAGERVRGVDSRAVSAPDDPLAAALAAAGLSGVLPGQSVPPAPRIEVVESRETEAEAEAGRPALWAPGAASGVGSMPGTDPGEAAATVVGELPLLPHLPELPARGVGADPIGRTAGLLVDLYVEVVPTAYRVTPRPGRDHRRAVDLLLRDLDAFTEAAEAARPSWVKVQVAGPWTLAAAVELHHGHRVLTDPGAVREFAASLAEGLAAHVGEVAARTGAQVVVQLDEPQLPAVLAGTLPTPSGYGTVAAVPEAAAQDGLRSFIAALPAPVLVRVAGERPPLRLLRGAGVAAIGIDGTARSLTGGTALPAALDAVGEVWDAGIPLLLGLVPAREPGQAVTAAQLAQRGFDLADQLGFDRVRLAELAVPTPVAGLAEASPRWAAKALGICREIATRFADPD